MACDLNGNMTNCLTLSVFVSYFHRFTPTVFQGVLILDEPKMRPQRTWQVTSDGD